MKTTKHPTELTDIEAAVLRAHRDGASWGIIGTHISLRDRGHDPTRCTPTLRTTLERLTRNIHRPLSSRRRATHISTILHRSTSIINEAHPVGLGQRQNPERKTAQMSWRSGVSGSGSGRH